MLINKIYTYTYDFFRYTVVVMYVTVRYLMLICTV